MPSAPDLSRQFSVALIATARKLRKVFDNNLKQREMTLSRARALFFLSSQSSMNQSELGALLDIANASVVSVVDGLERQDLLIRCPIEGNRRANRLQLTPAGERLAEEVEAVAQSMRIKVLQGITEDDLRTSMRVLEQMIANLNSRDFSHDQKS